MFITRCANDVFQSYLCSGLLVRGNDGQTPSSVEVINNAINRITIDSCAGDEAHPFSEMLENQAPAYSASLLSGMNSPLLWYNFDYSEAFPMKPANPMGERTIIGVVFGNGSIVVAGGCAWDADSNLGTLGNIPATAIGNRVSPTSIYPQLKVFENVAGYSYGPPNDRRLQGDVGQSPEVRGCRLQRNICQLSQSGLPDWL
jgi:hypothetical protein